MPTSTLKKIVLGSAAILALLVVSAVIAWYAFGKDFVGNSRRVAQLLTDEGKRFGRTADTRACLKRALALATECDDGALSCEIRAHAFVGGCIAEAEDIAAVCASLPKYEDRLLRLTSELNLCTSLGYEQTGGCQRVVKDLSVYCAKLAEHVS